MILVLVLRLIHIFTGVFWAGSSFFLVSFVTPTVKLTGSEGAKFMQTLARGNRLTRALAIAGGLNVLSGLLLYWSASGGFNIGWITSASGLSITVGAVVGVLALIVGAGVGRTNNQIMSLGQEMQAAGGPPSEAQQTEMQALQTLAESRAIIGSVLLSITLAGMSIAQAL